jgi:hypothetical protein
MTPRYISNVKWYKGNTHNPQHTLPMVEIGRGTPTDVSPAGYDFIAIHRPWENL